MRLQSALAVATLLVAAPLAAKAQPIDGPYVNLGLGYNYLSNTKVQDLTGPAGTSTGSVKLTGNGGFTGLGAVGYGFAGLGVPGLRAELEGDYRQSSMRIKQPFAIGGLPSSGGATIQSYGVMLNALYDFDVGANWIYPYLGAGFGYQWTDLTNGKAYINGTTDGFTFGGTKGSMAAQAIVGAAYPVGVPGLSLTTEFRFIDIFQKTKFNGAAVFPGSTTGVSAKLNEQLNYSFLVGVRYAFNVAPPPPPPAPAPVAAPAPAPARTYLVFFDWDRADLTDRARQVIAEAAQNVSRVQVTRIEVNGYTDTSGSKAYNQKLSVRRAENVAAELVRQGVPKEEITIQGFGQTRLLVPTADGVREPQNRRVEIILK